MSYLLDTNVISELIRSNANDNVISWVASRNVTDLFISVLTLGEIRKGIKGITDTRRYEKILRWLEVDLPDYFGERILPIDRKVADILGELQSRKGQPMPAIDALLAATAMASKLTLVTRNTKDFINIHLDFALINPWED